MTVVLAYADSERRKSVHCGLALAKYPKLVLRFVDAYGAQRLV